MVTTRPPKTIVKPTALGPVANTDTKLLIYGLFQKGRVLAQDAMPLLSSAGALSHYRDAGGEGFLVGSVIRLPNRWLRCFLLVMCTHPFAKKSAYAPFSAQRRSRALFWL